MQIYPIPKRCLWTNNFYKLPLTSFYITGTSDLRIFSALEKLRSPALKLSNQIDASIVCTCSPSFDSNPEGYKLEITVDHIFITANSSVGLYYGIMTLKQIIKEDSIPTCEIVDYPDLEVRGWMLDIARSKVPTLTTLKKIVDVASSLKINHLELYVEGFAFEYESFKKYLNAGNYITREDYMAIENYCYEHFIDFVPNQNGFGHMSDWLKEEEFASLAEKKDGFFLWGADRKPSTLDPSNPKSLEFIQVLYHDMLENRLSKYFHMNFDEPLELGLGNSKELVEKYGIDQVFLSFFLKCYEEVKKYNKIPLMWGDVLVHHPETVEKLPKDVLFVDWGYNKNSDFDSHAKMLSSKNVNFLLAPGTSSWASITSKYEDMEPNIKNAAKACKKYHGKGILITDWGDIGHLQYLSSSYLGLFYGALLGWSDASIDDARQVLISYIGRKDLADLLIQLSKYSSVEGDYMGYGTRLFSSILWAEHGIQYEEPEKYWLSKIKTNFITEENANKLRSFLLTTDRNLRKINVIEEEQKIILSELRNANKLLLILLDLNNTLANSQDIQHLSSIVTELENYKKMHELVWEKRNKINGYPFSVKRIEQLIEILTIIVRKETI